MGLDGGTKITRADVLRGASWRLATADASRSTRGGSISTSALIQGEKVDRKAVRTAELSSCCLTGNVLQHPIVADYLGHLYNKAAVMEFLLARGHDTFEDDAALHRHMNILRTSGTRVDHLRRMRDVFDIRLVDANFVEPRNASSEPAASSATSTSPNTTPDGRQRRIADAVCPVTEQPFLTAPVAVLVPCGHCLSCRAIKLLEADSNGSCHCSICDKAFNPESDVIELAPPADVEERLKQRLKKRKSMKLITGTATKKQKKESKQIMDQPGN